MAVVSKTEERKKIARRKLVVLVVGFLTLQKKKIVDTFKVYMQHA